MNKSSIFTNGNFQQTSLNDAYNFQSFSTYINTNGLQTGFSPKCIFCSSLETTSLVNDGGSFRKCNKCKKHFKALFIKN
jgi:hypothetical protein